MAVLESVNGVQEISRDTATGGAFHRYQITVDLGKDIRSELALAVIKNQWELLKLQSLGMSLEEIFLRLTIEEQPLNPNPVPEAAG